MRFIIAIIFLLVFGSFSKSYAKDKDSKTKFKNVSISTKTVTLNVNEKESSLKNDQEPRKAANKATVENTISSEEGEPGVVIDRSFEDKAEGRLFYEYEEEKADLTSGNILPYSFGVFRGVLNMGGKAMLVFESDEAIYFIEVYKEENKIKWKLYGKLSRG